MTVRFLLLQIVLLLSKAYGFIDMGIIELYTPLMALIVGNIIWALITFYGMIKNYKESKK